MACKLKSKAGTSSGSPPKSKNQRQTKKVRVEGEVATSVEKATSPPKSKKTRQTKKERVEEEVATSVEKAASPTKLKKPRQTNKARVEEEVATSVENAASPPEKPVTQEESRIIDKPMEDEEARKQYPKRYVGEVIKHCATVACGRVFFSDVRDDNPLDCLVEKLHIVRLTLN